MKTRNYVLFVMAIAFSWALILRADSQEPANPPADKAAEKPAAAPPADDMQKKMMEGMKKWMASIQPGKHMEITYTRKK